jgi:hypothetical protein
MTKVPYFRKFFRSYRKSRRPRSNHFYIPGHPVPPKGALRDVNNAGWDAVDADGVLSQGHLRRREVVWSGGPALFSFAKEPIKRIEAKGFGEIRR